jgi:hypothetical protein
MLRPQGLVTGAQIRWLLGLLNAPGRERLRDRDSKEQAA